MNIPFFVTISVTLLGVTLLLLYRLSQKKIEELRKKTHTAVQGGELLKITWEGAGSLAEIAANFNALGAKLEALKIDNESLKSNTSNHDALKTKVHAMANSMSQISMLTETGKQIAANLKLEEVMKQLFKQIYASLPSREIAILIKSKQKLHIFHINESGIQQEEETVHNNQEKKDILFWCFSNGKSAFLNDAQTDYAQFIFQPAEMNDGQKVASFFALPLNRGEEIIGSLAVYSDRKEAFEPYHLEMIASLASYTSLAIVNAGLFTEVEAERKKSDALLLNILPEEIAQELKEKGKAEARYYDKVTVLFTDFVNFTRISEQFSAKQLVSEIDFYFHEFDRIMLKYGIEKIKTIGDAYMAVAGLPAAAEDHAERCVNAAIEIIHFVKENHQKGRPLQIRIGLHSGHVVAGVVGQTKYAFDIWGDTVNTAARMEQNSESGKINISGATHELVKDKFKVISRGKINAKNKGEIEMYFVEE